MCSVDCHVKYCLMVFCHRPPQLASRCLMTNALLNETQMQQPMTDVLHLQYYHCGVLSLPLSSVHCWLAGLQLPKYSYLTMFPLHAEPVPESTCIANSTSTVYNNAEQQLQRNAIKFQKITMQRQ